METIVCAQRGCLLALKMMMVRPKRKFAINSYICRPIAVKVAPEFSIQYQFVVVNLFKIGSAEDIPLPTPLKEYLPLFLYSSHPILIKLDISSQYCILPKGMC